VHDVVARIDSLAEQLPAIAGMSRRTRTYTPGPDASTSITSMAAISVFESWAAGPTSK
jgi:hypothetical protein